MGDLEGRPAPSGGGVRGEALAWLVGLALIAPATVPYLAHYLGKRPGTTATGFLTYDMAYYSANAREHYDGGAFRPTYANPSDPADDAPRLYFQPMTLLLGVVGHESGLEPGTAWVGFGFLAAWACTRVALALYRRVVGLDSPARWIGLVAFVWGGGLVAASGAAWSLWTRPPGLSVAAVLLDPERVFRFDPEGGWWFLNFGRNLVFPNESLYHAIFLGAILAAIRGRYGVAASLAALAGVSHPFTGIELLGVLGTWAVVERGFVGNRGVPRWFVAACAGLSAAHLGYYLGFLNGDPAHRSLASQWRQDWGVDAVNFLPAYALAGGFALWRLRRLPLAAGAFASAANRLFLVWFLVAFAMANHEFAIRPPIQPIHFTRGYDWIPLFLLGAPALVGLLDGILRWRSRPLRRAAVALILLAFLADNALWFAAFPLRVATGRPTSDLYLTPDQRQVLAALGRPEQAGALVVASDLDLGYLASVYTPLRSWAGHVTNTPEVARRQAEIEQFLATGRMPAAWEARPVVVVAANNPFWLRKASAWLGPRHAEEVLRNAGYVVLRIPPAKPPAPGRVGRAGDAGRSEARPLPGLATAVRPAFRASPHPTRPARIGNADRPGPPATLRGRRGPRRRGRAPASSGREPAPSAS